MINCPRVPRQRLSRLRDGFLAAGAVMSLSHGQAGARCGARRGLRASDDEKRSRATPRRDAAARKGAAGFDGDATSADGKRRESRFEVNLGETHRSIEAMQRLTGGYPAA